MFFPRESKSYFFTNNVSYCFKHVCTMQTWLYVGLYGLPLVYSCGILISWSCYANDASVECMLYLICVLYILWDEVGCVFLTKQCSKLEVCHFAVDTIKYSVISFRSLHLLKQIAQFGFSTSQLKEIPVKLKLCVSMFHIQSVDKLDCVITIWQLDSCNGNTEHWHSTCIVLTLNTWTSAKDYAGTVIFNV